MKPMVKRVGRFGGMHGWANRILYVDLDNMGIGVQETVPYVPTFLGGRGLAARICWDKVSEPVGPFQPANPLLIFPGALAGSHSPYSGRTSVCAFSPQAYPRPWFTRSNVGGYFGGGDDSGLYHSEVRPPRLASPSGVDRWQSFPCRVEEKLESRLCQ